MINKLLLSIFLIVGLLYGCSSGGDAMINHQPETKSNLVTTTVAKPGGPCSDPAYTQMDFWVGSWNGRSMVPDTSRESGWRIGKVQNTINKILDGCVIEENFEGKTFSGKSYSTYNKQQKIWHQTWVDNSGGYLPLYGIFENDKNIFRRDFVRNEKKVSSRMVFYNITGDSFTWDWESSKDEGKTWTLSWRIEYTRNM